jgi:hypothetical protein
MVLLAAAAWAQPTQNVNVAPACQMFFSFAAIGTTASYDNRTNGCDFWVISYSSFTFAGPLSMSVQRAANAAGSVPGAFANYAGAEVVAGINPNTSIVGAETQISGYNPWVRVNLSATGAGAGLVVGTIYGWRTGPPSMVSFLGTPNINLAQYGGVAVGAGNALHVRPGTGAYFPPSAVAAVADALASNASLGAGPLANFNYAYDGTAGTWNRLRGTAFGLRVEGTTAAGGTILQNPTIMGGYGSGVANGTAQGIAVCDLYSPITLAAAVGYTEIVPLIAGRLIRVCNISISFAASETPSLYYGTGANCAVGTTAITGAYSNILALALDFAAPLRVPAAQALCVRQTVGSGGGGLVNYAIY